MFDCWFNLLHLATESQQVIGLRMWRLGGGGVAAQDEALLMVVEKVDAGMTAAFALMAGASPDRIVTGIRREVQANAERLSRPA